jgi:PKD repeat protein
VDYSINGIAYHRNNVPNLYNEVATNVTANRYYEFMTVSDNHGCAYTYAAPLKDSVVVNALPTATLAPDTVCVGDDASILFTRGTGAGTMEIFYNVQSSPAGSVVIPSGSTTASATVFGVTSRTIVQITRITDSLCEHIYSGNGPINYISVTALPSVSILAPSIVCHGAYAVVTFGRSTTDSVTTVNYVVNDITNGTVNIPHGVNTVNDTIWNIEETTTVRILSVYYSGTGCTRNYDENGPMKTIAVATKPEIGLSAVGDACLNGDATFTIDRLIGSGAMAITYTVNGANPVVVNMLNGQNSVTQTISPLSSIDTVRVTNVHVLGTNNCNYAYVDSLMPTLVLIPQPLPVASITPVDDSICAGETAVFILESLGSNSEDWSVFYKVNGQATSAVIPAFVNQVSVTVPNASANQVIEINRIVKNTTGCQTIYTAANAPRDTIVVSPKPAVSFTNHVVSLGQLQFTSLANAAEIASWEWDFGDGYTSNDTNPLHTYAGTAVYDVCLTVTSVSGCVNTICKEITVNTVLDLAVDFNINNASQCLNGNLFSFNNTSSISTSGYYLDRYFWDFGDGTTDTLRHGLHTYSDVGTYIVKLVVWEAPGGSSDSITKVVRVVGKPIITDGAAPAPVCDGSLLSVNQPAVDWRGNTPFAGTWMLDSIIFDPFSTPVYMADDGKILRYRVESVCGDTVSVGVPITVIPRLTLDTVPNLTLCSGDTLDYTPAATGGTNPSFSWQRLSNALVTQVPTSGDSTIHEVLTSLSNNPLQVYYNVTINNQGCTSTQTITAVVNPVPVLTSSTDPVTLCNGQPFVYSVQTSTSGATFAWTRGTLRTNPANSGTANYINEVLVNDTTIPIVAKYFITLSYGSCSTIDSIEVTINPAVTVTSMLVPDSICSKSFFNYEITTDAANASFAWHRLPNANIVEPVSSGIDALITEQLTSRADTDVVVTYIVNIAANGCQSAATAIQVKVKPLPTLVIATQTPLLMYIGDVDTVAINTNGTLISWVSNDSTIARVDTAHSQLLITALTEGITTIKLIAENEAGCRDENSFIVNVNAPPVATIDLTNGQVTEFCSASPVTLQFEIAGGNAPYEVVYARIHNNDTIEYTVNNVLQSVHQFTVMLPANDSNFVDTVVYQLISVVDANSHSLVIVPNDIVLNILPKSKVDTIGNIIVCEGTNVEIPAFTTPTIPGTSVHYTWYNNNQAVGLVMSGQVAQGDSIPAFLAANPMDIPATAKITVTPYFTGTTKVCQGDAMTFDITVNSKPDFTVTNPLPICAGTAYNPNADIATLIQTLKPTSAVVTFYRDVTCLDTIKATDIDVFNSTTTIYARATSVDACESDVKSIVVTVQSLELAGNTHISVCSGETFNYVANSTWNNTNYTWERPAIDGISNPAVSGTGANISERLILDDTVTTYYTAIYAFTMQSATCQAYDTLRVDVYPAAHLTTLLDTICSGDSISYLPDAGALNAITTFEWTRFENANIAQPISSGTGAINERLTNTSNHSVVVIYEYIITTGTCSHRENFRVIVNPTPKPNVLHQRFDPICSNSIFTAELTNSVAEANIMWQRVPNADITPDVNLAVFNSGSHIEDTLTNGTQNVVTVFYHVEYEAYGCTFVDTVSVDVNPLPIMTGNHTPDAICSGTAFNYLIETAPSNTTVTWMRAINDSIAELPVVGNTKLIAETLTNIRDTATTVKYIVSIANGLCVKEDSLSVIVNPFPTVAVLNDTTVCHADSIVITPTGTATKYIFTTSTHIGMANSVEIVQGSVLTFETANTTGAPLTATITVTPVYESGINSCYGHTSTFKITVNPLPGLTPVEDMAFCAGSSVPSYQFTGLTAGANYTWQRIAGNAITSLPTQGINSLPAFTANNLTDSFLVATYEVSATHTYNGVTCSYNRDTFNITVYNQAILSPMEDVEVCALSETDTIFFTGSNNTVFDWIKVSGVNIGSPLVGTGNFMPPFTAQNNNSYVRSATYTVTPRIAGTACIGTARNFTIYVNPTAVLSSAIYNDTLCSGELFEYTATSVTNNVLYRWSRPVVVGINNGVAVSNQGNVIREVLTNSADTTITVPYYISLTHENCTHIDTIYVPVKAAQMLSLDTNNFVVCQGTAQFNVTFTLSNPSLPTNYKLVFDNNANMQGLFSMTSYQALTSDTSIIVSMPNAIAPGNYTATLYIETNGCTQSVGQNFVITVLQGTVITKEPRAIEVLCENYGALHLEVNALGTNVTYQWYHDGTAISGATTSVYDVESPTATEYGEYYVVVSGECGEDTSITVQVIDNFVQIGVMWTDVLFVSNNDTNMLALEFAYYQWYKWNEAAGKFVSIYRNSDAQSFYEPDGLGGMYMVEIFYKNGESFMSCPFIYTIQEEVVAIPTILYPNPAPLGIFNVQLGDDFKDMDLSKLTIEVTTLSGTVVGTTVPTDRITEVRMGLAPAVYVVKVKNASGKVMLTTIVVVK